MRRPSVYTPASQPSATEFRARQFETTINFRGFAYTRAYVGTNRDSYHCSVYRSTKCAARLIIAKDGNRTRPDGVTTIREHTCVVLAPLTPRAAQSPTLDKSEEEPDLSYDYESPAPPSPQAEPEAAAASPAKRHGGSFGGIDDFDDEFVEIIDAKDMMEDETDRLVIMFIDKPATAIWNMIREEFYEGHTNEIRRGLTREQVISRVYRARNSRFGDEGLAVIERPPLAFVKGSSQPFLQFNHAFFDQTTLHRVVGFAYPALLSLLNYRCTALFIDGTFKSVPRSFYQCLVIMVYDEASDMYVPVFHVLLTGQSELVYARALACVKAATGGKIDPATVTCDFELGLHNAVKFHFSDASIIGCFFHWKQAIRRWLLKNKMPEAEVGVALGPGFLEKLTVTEYHEVREKAIPWIQQRLAASCRRKKIGYSTEIWDKFWVYFDATWVRRFGMSSWNYTKVDGAIVNRTNNPLERYNRTLNGLFVGPHPSLVTFVSVIEDHSRKTYRTLPAVVSLYLTMVASRLAEPGHQLMRHPMFRI